MYFTGWLNPKVDTPPFAATIAAAAAPLQLYQYQGDLVHQPWSISEQSQPAVC